MRFPVQASGDVTRVCLMLCKERAIVAALAKQAQKMKGSLESQYIFFLFFDICDGDG